MHGTDIGVDGTSGRHQRMAEAFDLLRRGETAGAKALADHLVSDHPADPDVVALACEACLAEDAAQDALDVIDRALAAGAPPASVLPRRAHVLMALMRRADAREVAAQVAALADEDGRMAWTAGRIYSRCDDPASAIACFETALGRGVRDPELLYDLASAQFFTGDVAQAERHLDELLAKIPLAGDALYLRSTLRSQSPSHNHVDELDAKLKQGFDHAVDAAGCLYAIAKELEDLDRPDRSFEALSQGASLKRRSLQYDAGAERAAIDAIREAYTASVVDTTESRDAEAGAGHVFIVGMPRTGTTLVERILGRHPDAASAGELPYFGGALATAVARRMKDSAATNALEASLQIDFAALGLEYVSGARQAVRSDAPAVIDKMPINFMYCGLIRKALPRARIVHVRREPMDACYAIYKTLFQQAYHFSYDLDELAAYYATYHRLMAHWHEVMPDGMLDVSYEELVSDPAQQARRLLDWCGLEWDAAVLDTDADQRPSTTASAAQVRRPVHTDSVGKWRQHEAGLAPLERQLREAGIVD